MGRGLLDDDGCREGTPDDGPIGPVDELTSTDDSGDRALRVSVVRRGLEPSERIGDRPRRERGSTANRET